MYIVHTDKLTQYRTHGTLLYMIASEMRVEALPEKSETVAVHHIYFPLRAKLFVVFVFAMVLLGAAIFLAPYLKPPLDLYLIITAAALSCVYLVVIFELSYIRPLRTLLRWFQNARESSFATVGVMPVASSDEIGHLATELGASISNFWNQEKRIEVLLSHKGDTMSLIEHQLRTPLTALRWSLEGVSVPPNVQIALLRMEITVGAIIDASRIEEGKFGYVFGMIDVVGVIEKTVKEFTALAESKHIQLTFEHAPDLPHVHADEQRIGIVMANLLSNAIDYTPSGGRVQVSAVAVENQVEITVQDTGIGIPSTELLLIFNKFYRGANAVKMHPDGSGLGLFVTKNILHAHESEIVIRSVERQGTAASFRLTIVR